MIHTQGRERRIHWQLQTIVQSVADLSLKPDMTLSDLFSITGVLILSPGLRTMDFRGQEYLHSTRANLSSFEIIMMNSQQPASLYIQEEEPEPRSWYGLLRAGTQEMHMKINRWWLCESLWQWRGLILFIEGV